VVEPRTGLSPEALLDPKDIVENIHDAIYNIINGLTDCIRTSRDLKWKQTWAARPTWSCS
jgi:hypothetical protein